MSVTVGHANNCYWSYPTPLILHTAVSPSVETSPFSSFNQGKDTAGTRKGRVTAWSPHWANFPRKVPKDAPASRCPETVPSYQTHEKHYYNRIQIMCWCLQFITCSTNWNDSFPPETKASSLCFTAGIWSTSIHLPFKCFAYASIPYRSLSSPLQFHTSREFWAIDIVHCWMIITNLSRCKVALFVVIGTRWVNIDISASSVSSNGQKFAQFSMSSSLCKHIWKEESLPMELSLHLRRKNGLKDPTPPSIPSFFVTNSSNFSPSPRKFRSRIRT